MSYSFPEPGGASSLHDTSKIRRSRKAAHESERSSHSSRHLEHAYHACRFVDFLSVDFGTRNRQEGRPTWLYEEGIGPSRGLCTRHAEPGQPWRRRVSHVSDQSRPISAGRRFILPCAAALSHLTADATAHGCTMLRQRQHPHGRAHGVAHAGRLFCLRAFNSKIVARRLPTQTGCSSDIAITTRNGTTAAFGARAPGGRVGHPFHPAVVRIRCRFTVR